MYRCDECGFEYDLDEAIGAALEIVIDLDELGTLLGSGADLATWRRLPRTDAACRTGLITHDPFVAFPLGTGLIPATLQSVRIEQGAERFSNCNLEDSLDVQLAESTSLRGFLKTRTMALPTLLLTARFPRWP